MALSVDIADAVVTKLNAGKTSGTFTQVFTAERRFIARDRFEDINGYKVYVVPKAFKATQFDRESVQADYEIDIAVAIKVDTDAAVEKALDFSEQIQDYLAENANHEIITDVAVWLPTYSSSPIYDATKLDEMNLFLSVTNVKYSALR